MRLIDILINEYTIPQIQNNIDDQFLSQKIKTDELQSPVLKFASPYGELRFTVKSSTNVGVYSPVIRFDDWKTLVPTLPNNITSVNLLLQNSNIKVYCNCPSFKMHGYQYILTTVRSAISPEMRAPNKTNPQRRGIVCKHLRKVIETLPQFNTIILKNINLYKKFI